MPREQVIDPEWAWDEDFPLAQGLMVGDQLFMSGQVALDPEGNVIGKGDLRRQSQQVFENMQTILKRAGAEFSNVVKLTTYFTCDLSSEKINEYFEVRRQYFGSHKPSSTGVRVLSLVNEDLLLEVEAVAIVPPKRSTPKRRSSP